MKFRPVKDPITGKIDMIETPTPEWGDQQRSQGVSDIFGAERYNLFYPEEFDGTIENTKDLHDATIIEMMSIIAPHTSEEDVSRLARSWVDTAELVRKNILKIGTIAFLIDDMPDSHGERTLVVANITNYETIVTVFCKCGDVLLTPITYWNNNGKISICEVPEENVDDSMVDISIQERRWDMTRLAITAYRKQQEYAPNVIDMGSFKTIRAIAR